MDRITMPNMPNMSKKLKFRGRIREPGPAPVDTKADSSPNSTPSPPLNRTPAVALKTQPEKPVRKSPLRSLNLRAHKRRRSPPPAEFPSSPPPAIVTHSVGIEQHSTKHSSAEDAPREGSEFKRDARQKKKPTMPAFLDYSVPDLYNKWQNITWSERNRITYGISTSERGENEPIKYQHVDVKRIGMDRYINIKPWAHNRVRLKVPHPELDYINASPIVLESPSDPNRPALEYIAMQGPTEHSLEFVWRMVAEQLTSPVVIVQLTNMVEGGSQKCFPYFPYGASSSASSSPTDEKPAGTSGAKSWRLNNKDSWNDNWAANLRHEETKILANGAIELRRLSFHVDGEDKERVVWHFLYTRWPDFGVPALDDIGSFFELMKLSREYNTAGLPRIIHCSAGVGRTGTFITLEHLIRELDAGYLENYDVGGDEQPDLIFKTVDALREQRKSMVQAEPQFFFLYQVMRKLWIDKYGDVSGAQDEPSAKRLEVAGASPR